jgi:hypothetical protein
VLRYIAWKSSGSVLPIHIHNHSGYNSLYSVGTVSELVHTIDLKDIVAKTSGEDLILKMDCEGGEWDILLHQDADTIRKFVHIAMELHCNVHPEYNDPSVMHKKLESCGFVLVYSAPFAEWEYDQQGNVTSWTNLPVGLEIWKRV